MTCVTHRRDDFDAQATALAERDPPTGLYRTHGLIFAMTPDI